MPLTPDFGPFSVVIMIGPASVSRTFFRSAAGPVGISTFEGFGGGVGLADALDAAGFAPSCEFDGPPELPQPVSAAARAAAAVPARRVRVRTARRRAREGCGCTFDLSDGGTPRDGRTAAAPGGACPGRGAAAPNTPERHGCPKGERPCRS
ncbi:hypothetical protein GCM10009663_57720 [Kitasatospora arboriphila]|uniref:Uncharacterized protein n=1 Tax=Kitasatospora arboriphila TaxID=258052 RepID=A0ABN1TZX1_9ACTN